MGSRRAVRGWFFVLLMTIVAACQLGERVTVPEPLALAPLYLEPTAAPALPTPASDRRVIEFWTDDNESGWVATYRQVAEHFMAQHPEVELRIVPVNEASLAARLASAREAEALPDIVRLGIERVATLADDGVLDEGAAESVIRALGEDSFYPRTLEMVRQPQTGRYLAVPYDGWIQAIWYRADHFEALGLAPPTTWEAVRAAAQALPQSGTMGYGIVLPTDPHQNYVQQFFEQVAISNDAWPFDETGTVTMDSPQMIEALAWYDSLYPYAPSGAQYWRGARERYLRDQVGQIVFSTYIMDDLIEGVTAEDGYAVEPTIDDLASRSGFAPVLEGPNGSATYGQLVTLAVLRDADPLAASVVEFFLTEGYLDILALDTFGKVPVLKDRVGEWGASSQHFSAYSEETIIQVAGGYDTMQRWFLRADYDATERALIGEIEGELLIPQVIYEMTVTDSLTPDEAAARLQAQVEALAGGDGEGR